MSKKSEAAVPAETQKAAVPVPAVKEKKKALVWCGPTLRNIARQYTVYHGEAPKALKAFIKEHPAAKGMLVEIDKFAETRIKIEKPGTVEAILYNKIKKEI